MSLLMLTTFVSFLGAFMHIIIKPIMSFLCVESKQELMLQQEINALKKEMTHISMVDEFAKHARLQRRLNKVQEDLKGRANMRISSNVKLKIVVTYVAQLIVGLILIFLIWNYKYTPVVVLPVKWLQPFGNIFSWPTDVAGSVSITMWIVITGTVSKLAASSFS